MRPSSCWVAALLCGGLTQISCSQAETPVYTQIVGTMNIQAKLQGKAFEYASLSEDGAYSQTTIIAFRPDGSFLITAPMDASEGTYSFTRDGFCLSKGRSGTFCYLLFTVASTGALFFAPDRKQPPNLLRPVR
ncbi:hypothetical protein FHS94_003862 [Sphingomonas aerophila]|uniref:Uncharacterized protein n=1 Tax=Sphingomonas aerophila TaxID=1344948 RepID=A0A7W9EW33_9SPHN|nr:hypothetical protein [Sphingomonas aerophila]